MTFRKVSEGQGHALSGNVNHWPQELHHISDIIIVVTINCHKLFFCCSLKYISLLLKTATITQLSGQTNSKYCSYMKNINLMAHEYKTSCRSAYSQALDKVIITKVCDRHSHIVSRDVGLAQAYDVVWKL